MKIGIDVSQIVYEGSGVASYVKNLTKHLLELKTDHKFVFYAGVLRQKDAIIKLKNSKPWNRAAWKIWPIPPKAANFLFNKKNLDIKPFIGNVDVFHASDWSHPETFIPTVTTVHDLVFKKYPKTVDPTVLAVQKSRLDNLVKHSSHIIVDSKSTKKDLHEFYDLDYSRMTTIYLGCDPIYSPQSKKSIKDAMHACKLKSKYIMTLGTKEPRKNLQKTIEAFKSLKEDQKYKDLTLLIVGRHGWGDPVTEKRKDIIETGYLDQALLPALYSGAEAFVYPSLYEGFGIPVLEAMACGAPVVTSDLSSLPEVAGDAGVLVDPGDVFAITKGIKKALTRKSTLSDSSLKQAKKFSWELAAKKTLDIYEKVFEANQ